MAVINVAVVLEVHTCPTCGIAHGVPENIVRYNDGSEVSL